jgi:hypothetical protein
MDIVRVSYLAARYAKNEVISGHTVTIHTVDDLTTVSVYDKDFVMTEEYIFRDVFRSHRKINQG